MCQEKRAGSTPTPRFLSLFREKPTQNILVCFKFPIGDYIENAAFPDARRFAEETPGSADFPAPNTSLILPYQV